MDKGVPSVGRGRETDVGSSAIPEAALLESRNDRVAKGKAVRLNLGMVLTGVVVERIAADLDEGLTRGLARRMCEPPGCECKREGCNECQNCESNGDSHSPLMARNS